MDHRADSGVRRANQRQAFFDRAYARLLEMLIGAARNAEPAVIGDIDDPARPRLFGHHLARKDDLVADQGQRRRRAGHSDWPATIAGEKTAALFGELLEAETFEEVLERKIFAERHQMSLVVK